MREISLSSGDWDDLDEDGGGLGFGSWDMSGLNATSQEIGQVLDAVSEADAELEAWAAGLTDDELAELEAEGAGYPPANGYPAAMGPGGEFATWMDGLDDDQFAGIRAEGRAFGVGELDYLQTAHQIDRALASTAEREHIRLAQDRDDQDRRRGAHHRRPSDEIILSNGLARYGRGSYLPNQLVDLANDWSGADPFADTQFGTSTATPEDVRAQLAYEINGGIAPGRSRRQPLPPVHGLARRIGLR